jgi:predicted transcriptional regulator YheO
METTAVYHKWTANEEKVIKKYYEGGRYKGIIHDIAHILQLSRQKIANHIREMRKHKRL